MANQQQKPRSLEDDKVRQEISKIKKNGKQVITNDFQKFKIMPSFERGTANGDTALDIVDQAQSNVFKKLTISIRERLKNKIKKAGEQVKILKKA